MTQKHPHAPICIPQSTHMENISNTQMGPIWINPHAPITSQMLPTLVPYGISIWVPSGISTLLHPAFTWVPSGKRWEEMGPSISQVNPTFPHMRQVFGIWVINGTHMKRCGQIDRRDDEKGRNQEKNVVQHSDVGPIWVPYLYPHIPTCIPNGSHIEKVSSMHTGPMWANPDAP